LIVAIADVAQAGMFSPSGQGFGWH
jgi:hypothetical protein